MINHLSVRDFAIIDNIDIDFHKGLNILTGETGSGKSIIIEAVSLALGSRADTAFVRTGKNKAVIQLSAEDSNGHEMIITREILATGKSTCKINDDLVTVAHLNNISKKIADIHGQYDHQSLLNPDMHIDLLDAYQSSLLMPLKDSVKIKYKLYAEACRELSELLANQAEASRKKDFMLFELNEINTINPRMGEDEELASELMMLQNSETIARNLSSAYDFLYDRDDAAISHISKSMNLLQELSPYNTAFQALFNDLEEAYYKLEETVSEIRRHKYSTDIDPARIDMVVERIDQLGSLKRKYGDSIEKILKHRDKLILALESIDHSDERADGLQHDIALYEKELADACAMLSLQRKNTAKAIEQKIDQELRELHFNDASLTIRFLRSTSEEGRPLYTENGFDRVEFLITTNKGELPKPLAKIASGGEISRIMLAFKRIIGDYDEIPTMIFDEIDSGISGITASVVGKKLSAISRNHQIICITHLPQIAAMGDNNYRILKKTEGDHTFTIIEPLSDEEKTKEIARMLAGMDITEHSLKNAEDLIATLKANV